MSAKKFLVTISILFLFFVSIGAQEYRDTLWVKVTFYDFHADGSNPEFNPDDLGKLAIGMVADTLRDLKPILGKDPYFNYKVDKWFRPWSPGDFTIPVYSDSFGKNVTFKKVSYDTAFKNIKIEDSLPFLHQGSGMYKFERKGDNQFFWLDGKGFKNEPKGYSHNFSFTMELHTTFVYKKGMTFDFLGDDDVWAFVNGKLAMDLGGMHSSEDGSISLDDEVVKYDLIEGRRYPFDFFYAERHVDSSTITVMTNLFTPQSSLRLYGKSGTPDINGNIALSSLDTLPVGEKIVIYPHVFDSIKWRPEWDNLVTWEISNPEAVKSEPAQNGALSLLASKISSQITLTAKFINPDDPSGKPIFSVIKLVARPGKPYQITFQKTKEIVQIEAAPLSAISITEQESSAVLYAVVRDSMGNFIRFSDKTQWRTSDAAIGTVFPESGNIYKGIITKVKSGKIQVTANESGLKPAVVEVVLSTPVVVIPVSHIDLTNAITADRDGDGYLDMITLRFDSTLTISNQSAIANMQISSNGIQFKVDSISSISGGSTGTEFQLYIHEATTGGFQTGWKPVITIIANPDMAPISTFECTDGAGPVIGRALYYPGTLKTGMNSSGTPDTIYITVSEKVKLSSNNDPNGLFAYYQKGIIKTDVFGSIIDINDSTAKLIVSDGFTIESLTDSLQLISINGVVDQYSNKPDANSRKTTVESAKISVIYTQSSNPIVSGSYIKEPIRDYFESVIKAQTETANMSGSTPGVIIGVSVKGKLLKTLPDGSFGKAAVYDAVGNLVRSLKVTKVIGNEYGIYWDTKNANMRNVSIGTYLVVVNISDVSGKSRQDRFKVGIKKEM